MGITRDTIDAASSKLLVRTALSGVKTYYVYGIGLLYEANASGETKTYHFDQVGSTIARTNDAGVIIGQAEYSAYGVQFWKSGDMATPFLYNGQAGVQTDANGLLNMRARYYCPYLMRFLNADPSGFGGGSNWFAYADGNPISKNDPFGLWSSNQTWGVVKAIGGAAEVGAGITLGAATSWTGVGAVAGGAVAIHGVDTFQSGFRQALTGELTDTYTSTALQAGGLSPLHANLVDVGIGLASGGISLISGTSKTAAIMRLPEAADMSIPRALGAWERGSVAMSDFNFGVFGGELTSPIQKAQAMANGLKNTTTPFQSLGKSVSLWNTGLTPLGDFATGGAATLSYGSQIGSVAYGNRNNKK